MPKLYFSQYDETHCYPKSYYVERMKELNIKELRLYEAKIERDTGYFYCREYGQADEVGNCGKACEKYKPRNGKSGICSHHGPVYEMTDKILTIKLK